MFENWLLHEEWRAVPGYEGLYSASTLGRIKSLQRGRRIGNKILSAAGGHKGGYLIVALSKGGITRTFSVHRLVLLAFVGARPTGLESRHLDGNPANNRVANLCYATWAENDGDKDKHNTRPRGENHWHRTMTDALVREIRTSHERICDIAKRLNKPPSTISRIRSRLAWRHVV